MVALHTGRTELADVYVMLAGKRTIRMAKLTMEKFENDPDGMRDCCEIGEIMMWF